VEKLPTRFLVIALPREEKRYTTPNVSAPNYPLRDGKAKNDKIANA
jgi:hypothetical protein